VLFTTKRAFETAGQDSFMECWTFALIHSLHTFVAAVEGQLNVIKGDSLFLMDGSRWLVRDVKIRLYSGGEHRDTL
jgi:hypothetical protein